MSNIQTLELLIPLNTIPNNLQIANNLVYSPSDFKLTELEIEAESKEYKAHTFKLNELEVVYREAKITPTKTGQFVTLWKRFEKGPIQPFESTDSIDLFIISVQNGGHFGQFIFPKSVLIEKNIISNLNKEGKRAIRVYPPWDTTNSKQAQQTQLWQLEHFIEIPKEDTVNLNQAKKLLSLL